MEEFEGNCTTLVPEAFPPGEIEADRRKRLLGRFYYWEWPCQLISHAGMMHKIVELLLRDLLESHRQIRSVRRHRYLYAKFLTSFS